MCPSLAPTSGCLGRNVAEGWPGWQGCHTSCPEGDCGFENEDSLRALRQVLGLAADRMAESGSKLAPAPCLRTALWWARREKEAGGGREGHAYTAGVV